jgi:hypothetical protein
MVRIRYPHGADTVRIPIFGADTKRCAKEIVSLDGTIFRTRNDHGVVSLSMLQCGIVSICPATQRPFRIRKQSKIVIIIIVVVVEARNSPVGARDVLCLLVIRRRRQAHPAASHTKSKRRRSTVGEDGSRRSDCEFPLHRLHIHASLCDGGRKELRIRKRAGLAVRRMQLQPTPQALLKTGAAPAVHRASDLLRLCASSSPDGRGSEHKPAAESAPACCCLRISPSTNSIAPLRHESPQRLPQCVIRSSKSSLVALLILYESVATEHDEERILKQAGWWRGLSR